VLSLFTAVNVYQFVNWPTGTASSVCLSINGDLHMQANLSEFVATFCSLIKTLISIGGLYTNDLDISVQVSCTR